MKGVNNSQNNVSGTSNNIGTVPSTDQNLQNVTNTDTKTADIAKQKLNSTRNADNFNTNPDKPLPNSITQNMIFGKANALNPHGGEQKEIAAEKAEVQEESKTDRQNKTGTMTGTSQLKTVTYAPTQNPQATTINNLATSTNSPIYVDKHTEQDKVNVLLNIVVVGSEKKQKEEKAKEREDTLQQEIKEDVQKSNIESDNVKRQDTEKEKPNRLGATTSIENKRAGRKGDDIETETPLVPRKKI